MQKKTTRKNTKRPMQWLAAFAFIVWAPSITSMHIGAAPSTQRGIYTVSRGESLWTVAARVAGRDTDINTLVDRIAAINQLHGAELQPGQHIRLPSQVAE
jgi:nucleoid-associated protein YgaU